MINKEGGRMMKTEESVVLPEASKGFFPRHKYQAVLSWNE